ncbi:TPA: host-nuclease inhibitor protein Gam [Escherichia coli]|nr:host-nuclease inhibitor protein Gam [Escherichia coli]
MDINTETEIKQKHSLTPFPVFLISLAFRGRYFHSHFQEFSHERLLHSGSSRGSELGASLPADRP